VITRQEARISGRGRNVFPRTVVAARDIAIQARFQTRFPGALRTSTVGPYFLMSRRNTFRQLDTPATGWGLPHRFWSL
jgi:hypothetical protein